MDSICKTCANCAGVAHPQQQFPCVGIATNGATHWFTPVTFDDVQDYGLWDELSWPTEAQGCARYIPTAAPSPMDPTQPLPRSPEELLALNREIDETLAAESPIEI